jgi:hypothetical protein
VIADFRLLIADCPRPTAWRHAVRTKGSHNLRSAICNLQ